MFCCKFIESSLNLLHPQLFGELAKLAFIIDLSPNDALTTSCNHAVETWGSQTASCNRKVAIRRSLTTSLTPYKPPSERPEALLRGNKRLSDCAGYQHTDNKRAAERSATLLYCACSHDGGLFIRPYRSDRRPRRRPRCHRRREASPHRRRQSSHHRSSRRPRRLPSPRQA